MKTTIAAMLRRTQDDNRDIIARMPDRATTAGQLKLQKNHGTPREFSVGCVAAIGEISPLEAHVAIRKYLNEWTAA